MIYWCGYTSRWLGHTWNTVRRRGLHITLRIGSYWKKPVTLYAYNNSSGRSAILLLALENC